MAQNEMEAMRGMPLRVRSMEGLGPTRNLDWFAAHAHEISALFERVHKVLDREFQFILIAPVVFDLTVGGIARAIEPFFDVVVPDDGSADERDDPEAIASFTVRTLLPLLGFDSYGLPQPQLGWRHARLALGDAAT